MVTFTAKDRIEIVVEAEDDSHFYSGMVYPPAFGVPELVSRTSELRLLIHGAAIMAAILIGAMCLCLGAVRRFSRPYGAMAFLCFCFCGSTAWPLFQVMSESMYWVLLAERFCYYGMFFFYDVDPVADLRPAWESICSRLRGRFFNLSERPYPASDSG